LAATVSIDSLSVVPNLQLIKTLFAGGLGLLLVACCLWLVAFGCDNLY
jgi:hypothetical protein